MNSAPFVLFPALVLKHRKCCNHAGFLSPEKKMRQRERGRERSIGELSSDREGSRVLGGGVEPERKSFAEEDFARYQENIS